MLSLIVRMRALPGKEADYERLSREFGDHVEANRPGCHFFRTYPTDDPLEFVTIEHFEDKAALDAHQAHPHTLEAIEKLGGVIDGGVQPKIYSDDKPFPAGSS